MQWLYSLLVAIPLIAIFILTYIGNKRTPVPAGCETINCEGCAITSCSHHQGTEE